MDDRDLLMIEGILERISREQAFFQDVEELIKRSARRAEAELAQQAELEEVAKSILAHWKQGRGRPPKHVAWARVTLGYQQAVA